MAQFSLGGRASRASRSRDRELQAEIGGGPDIRPPEREDQVHLGAPPPDPLQRQQRRLGALVVGLGEPGEVEFAAADLFGETAGVTRLLPAEAAGAQGRVVEGQKRRRASADGTLR